ncbi:MAG: sulfotransferase domain-containing protein [Candidatus Paceibacterota bacterium]
MNRQPNFIYIGTSKAGSTWLFDVLSRHPDVYVTPAKGLYFFDHHSSKGWSWYLDHFSDATSERIVGEISHSYLYSEIACERIAAMNPDIKLMVCLREPIDRAFSMYLDGIRNGKWTGTFEERYKDTPAIVDEGCYARHLETYLNRFSRDQIHVTLFDDLRWDPKSYAQGVFEALEVPPMSLDSKLLTKVMPASLPRNKTIVHIAKRTSEVCRRLKWKKLRGRVKRSRLIRSLLFRKLREAEKASISPEVLAELKVRFQPDVERLDELLGMQLCQRWGYTSRSKITPLKDRHPIS